MKANIKGRFCNKCALIIFGAMVGIIILSSQVFAPPGPHNIEGRVYTNSSNGVQNGIPVRLNSTLTGDLVITYVSAPPSPVHRGEYSATINGEDAELIIGTSWNLTHYGEANTTLLSTTTILDIKLNKTRGSEINVTILSPINSSAFNKSIPFNLTANITITIANGIDCNATIIIYDTNIINVTSGWNYTIRLGSIPAGESRLANWTLVGLRDAAANITVSAKCGSDDKYLNSKTEDTTYNITIENIAPYARLVWVDSYIDLEAGGNTTVTCNASVVDYNTASDLRFVNATFYLKSTGATAYNDNNDHYSNLSCANTSSSMFEKNYTCGFNLAYYASNGTWECNITIGDYSNATNITNVTSCVNELLAVDVSPAVIDYGNLLPTYSSAQDVNITITNIGNSPFNISVYGFGSDIGDNLSMKCERRNISVWHEKYSIFHNTPIGGMIGLSANMSVIANISFPHRTSDQGYERDKNTTYWKLYVPPAVSGLCNGSVVFNAVMGG